MAAQISEFKQEVEVLKREKTQSDNELANVHKTYKELQGAKKKVEKSLTHEHDGHKREIKKLNAKLQGKHLMLLLIRFYCYFFIAY